MARPPTATIWLHRAARVHCAVWNRPWPNSMAPSTISTATATSTPAGDIQELKAIKQAFAGQTMPPISSTKSLAGHSLGATGVHEAIYCLLMMQHKFIAASANIVTLDSEAEGVPIVRSRRDDVTLQRVLSNSFGFGGTNACLALQSYPG